jgi:hypothetical protein
MQASECSDRICRLRKASLRAEKVPSPCERLGVKSPRFLSAVRQVSDVTKETLAASVQASLPGCPKAGERASANNSHGGEDCQSIPCRLLDVSQTGVFLSRKSCSAWYWHTHSLLFKNEWVTTLNGRRKLFGLLHGDPAINYPCGLPLALESEKGTTTWYCNSVLWPGTAASAANNTTKVHCCRASVLY